MDIPQTPEFHRVAQRWERLKLVLMELEPRTLDNLHPGVDDAAIEQLKALLAVPLPLEFEALYRMNDGEDAEKSILPYFSAPEPTAEHARAYLFMRMHGFDGVADELERFAEIGGFSREQRYPPMAGMGWSERLGPVRNVGASPGWIPFARDGSGNFLCVDVDPDDGGNVGQVIEVAYDISRLKVLAASFSDYLGTLVDNWAALSQEIDTAVGELSRFLPK